MRLVLSNNTNCLPDTFVRLARDKDYEIKENVVCNIGTPIFVLEDLMKNGTRGIRVLAEKIFRTRAAKEITL